MSIAVAVSLTGCVRHEPRADLVILNGAEPESLDPAIITGQPDGRVVLSLFEGLTRFDPKTGTGIPGLAERWEISEDGRIYTFHLRSNIVWSTGEPITADDFVYSWIRVLDPLTASDYAGQLFFLKNGEDFNSAKIKDPSLVGVRALNAGTLRVELNNPTAFFIDLCAFQTLAVVPRKAIERYGDQWIRQKPLPVSGAYTLESWRIHDKIRLRKNPRYWDAAQVQIEVADFLPIDAATTAMNIYKTGQADIIWDKNLVPTELIDVLRAQRDCHTFDYLGTYFVRFNVLKKPFDDVRVRKALALAIDKKRIVEKITRAGEKPAATFVPPGTARYHAPEGLGYDPARARKLLAEAGYPGGQGFPTFEYLFNTAELHKQIAVEMQEMWQRELGIRMELRQSEWKVYLNDLSHLNYEAARSSWIGDYNDPNTFLDMFFGNNGNNRTGWTNFTYEALVKEANLQTDLAKRERLLQQAEAILVRDELPILPLFFYVGVIFFDPDQIEGIYFNVVDDHPLRDIRKKKLSSVARRPLSVAQNRIAAVNH